MDRRTSIGALAGAALLAGVAQAQQKDDPKPAGGGHEHHHHGAGKYAAVSGTARVCVEKGEICAAHCIELLAEGDKAMAACARSVSDMLAVCRGLASLAARESRYVPAYAKLAAEVCKACEDECRKHEDKHVQCKDCAESCAACAKECKAIAA
jgi:Cys-rich four helix bundle protein (predicted Tat secretion target)